MSIATVVIPVSAQHWLTGIYDEAVQSVQSQTLPTDYILIHDKQKKGAGWARNQGTAKVTTPFVIWLDADDILHPEFVEQTIQHYKRGSFVYSNWQIHNQTRHAPPTLDPLGIGQQHIITTLMPVSAWRECGGFNETLPTLEDEDFYRKIACHGWRGVHCNQSLVTYRRDKGHSLVNRDAHDADEVQQAVKQMEAYFKAHYGRYEPMIELELHRNKPLERNINATGEKQPNDVLCEAKYAPMSQAGAVTGRKYPKTGFNAPLWVDIDDAQARPDLWRIVANNPQKISPDPKRITELVEQAKQAKPSPTPVIEAVTVDYSTYSLQELRDTLPQGISEADIVSDMSAHWKTRQKELRDYLEAQS